MAHNRRFNNQNDEKYDPEATQELQHLLEGSNEMTFSDEQVMTLIRRGANPNLLSHSRIGDTNITPLEIYAKRGNIDRLRELFQMGVNPNGDMIKAVLSSATTQQSRPFPEQTAIDIINLILDENPELIHSRGSYGFNKDSTLLIHAVRKIVPVRVIELLLERGADVDLQTEDGKTALMHAARGRNEVIDLLLRYGAENELENKSGRMAHNFTKSAYSKNKLPNRRGGKRSKIKTRRGKSRKSRKSRKTRRH